MAKLDLERVSSTLVSETPSEGAGDLRGKRAVVFEVYSLIHLVVAWRRVRSSDVIYFSRRVPFKDPPSWTKYLVTRLVRLLNPRAELRELSVEDLLDYLPLNAQAVDWLEALGPEICNTRAYSLIRSIIHDDMLIRFYQGALVRQATNWQLFPRVVERLSLHHTDVAVVPEWDTEAMHTGPGEFRETRGDGPRIEGLLPAVRYANRIRRLLKALSSRAQLAVLPTWFLLTRLRYGVRLKPRGPYAVAMPVVWGVRDSGALTHGINRPHNDEYLYGGSLKPGDIVHVFGDWVFPKPVADGFRRAMDARGIHYVDKSRFGIDPRTLWLALKVQLNLLKVLWPGQGDSPLEYLVLKYSPKAVYHYFRKHVEMGNVGFRVELVKNDYNPGHVVGTIVSRQHGVKTVGVQHNGLPYEAPELAFVHFDEFIVYGNLYAKGYERHWRSVKLQPTGRESIDWAVGIVHDRDRLAEVQRRWNVMYPTRGHTVLILLPSAQEICLRRQWEEMHKALVAFCETDLDCNVILRFRTRAAFESAHVRQFLDLPDRDPRFIVELTNFSTYELMALSDLVIITDGSFAGNEALAIGATVFSFEFIGAGRYYFRDYGKDFVLRNAADVLRVFGNINTSFEGFDCQWDALRRDANYHADGLNCHRIRTVVERAAGLTDLAPMEPSRTECSKVLL